MIKKFTGKGSVYVRRLRFLLTPFIALLWYYRNFIPTILLIRRFNENNAYLGKIFGPLRNFFGTCFLIFGYEAWALQLAAAFLSWVRRGSAGSAWLSRCGVAQFGCDVAQSGAEWASRAQFGSVKKSLGLARRACLSSIFGS